jgi:hypothetical protein
LWVGAGPPRATGRRLLVPPKSPFTLARPWPLASCCPCHTKFYLLLWVCGWKRGRSGSPWQRGGSPWLPLDVQNFTWYPNQVRMVTGLGRAPPGNEAAAPGYANIPLPPSAPLVPYGPLTS